MPIDQKTQRNSIQERQDDIFRSMSADEKVHLGGDFSIYGLKLGLAEGTPLPIWYLEQWLEKNQKTALLQLL